jgi:hypothetical protein
MVEIFDHSRGVPVLREDELKRPALPLGSPMNRARALRDHHVNDAPAYRDHAATLAEEAHETPAELYESIHITPQYEHIEIRTIDVGAVRGHRG